MIALFLTLLLEFPPGSSVVQVPAGYPGELRAEALWTLVGLDTDGNDGTYRARWLGDWPGSGMGVWVLDPPPAVADEHFHFYGVEVVPVLVFADGFESGDASAWSSSVEGSS